MERTLPANDFVNEPSRTISGFVLKDIDNTNTGDAPSPWLHRTHFLACKVVTIQQKYVTGLYCLCCNAGYAQGYGIRPKYNIVLDVKENPENPENPENSSATHSKHSRAYVIVVENKRSRDVFCNRSSPWHPLTHKFGSSLILL